MKVLVFTNLFPNSVYPNHGIFTQHRMGSSHGQDGCEIRVVAPVPYCPPWPALGEWYAKSRIPAFERIDGIDVYHPRYPLIPKISMPLHGFLMFLFSLQQVKRIHREFPFDLIDGHFVYPDGFAAVLLARAMKKPVVVSALGTDIHEFPRRRLIRPMIRYALSRSDLCLTVCDALKRSMVDLGTPEDKIRVIPSGVDAERFRPGDRAASRRELGIALERKIIVSVGSLIPVKGFQTIIDALPTVLGHEPTTELYIIGSGPYRKALEELAVARGVAQHVFLAGQRPNSELAKWYAAADVFCLASFREGWPNVVMESLACATPVVGTRVFGIPEILVSPDLGILVDPTPQSIAAGLVEALRRDWDRTKMRDYILDFTWTEIGARIRKALESVLRKRNLRTKGPTTSEHQFSERTCH